MFACAQRCNFNRLRVEYRQHVEIRRISYRRRIYKLYAGRPLFYCRLDKGIRREFRRLFPIFFRGEQRNIIPAIDYIPVDKEESVPDDPSEPENPDNPIVLPEPLRIIDYFSGSYRNFTLNLETQTFKVRTDELYFNGLAAAITLSSLFASTALGGAVAVIILKKKSRSYKNEG